jgi:2-keto-4-pentenoate hydratase/2-oxohepta-3-ene-1,7-dioic acid hydratase in catechol pathway
MLSTMQRLYRLRQNGETFYAVQDRGEFHRALLKGDDIFSGVTAGAPLAGGPNGARTLAPVHPSKIVCVGLNYRDHAAEVRKALPPEPLLFLKPSTSVINPEEPIVLPPGVGRVDHEAEVAIVIGRRAHRVRAANAWDYILGITALNDVTARDMQNREVQYTRCKGFDTFAPVGPCVALGRVDGPIAVEGRVNGHVRQQSTTAQLIFPIEHLVEYVTFVMTLLPGDIISTGTPSGIGPLAHGDEVTVTVEGVGDLRNPVIDEPGA